MPLLLCVIALGILSVIFPALYFPEIYLRDWRYFDSLSLFVRSSILKFHLPPWQDPWCGGGLNVLSNPQNRIFSPGLFLDLNLPPYWANLSSLAIYAALGAWGMVRLLNERFQVPRRAAFVAAAWFVNGTFFGLHFAEGHIVYGSMLLLPWIVYSSLRLEERWWQLVLCGLMALFLLDGGIYTFIFASAMLLSQLAVGRPSPILLYRAFMKAPQFSSACLFFSALLASPKIVPVYFELRQRRAELWDFSIPLASLFKILFYPFQNLEWVTPGSPFAFHEFGCYVGWILFLVTVAIFLRRRTLIRTYWREIILILFWLWVATGWFFPINPWVLFERIPVINNAHLQSRTIVIAFLFYCVLAGVALAQLKGRAKLTTALMLLILIESVVVRNYPFSHYLGMEPKKLTYQLIQSQTVERTEGVIDKPFVYLTRDRATRFCYEPSGNGTSVKATTDADYRGEVFVAEGTGNARIVAYLPGQIDLKVDGPTAKNVVINTNDLGHWKIVSRDGKAPQSWVASHRGERLMVRVPPGEQEIRIRFAPSYTPWILLAWLAGLGGFFVLGWRSHRQSRDALGVGE